MRDSYTIFSKFAFSVSIGLFLLSGAYADTVMLSNGDIISGTITNVTTNTITLQTSYAGTIDLDRSHVESYTSSETINTIEQAESEPVWKGRVRLGINHKSASTRTEDYRAGIDNELRYENWRHNFTAEYAYKRDDASTKTNNYGGRISTDRFLNEKLFIQGRAMHKWDHIEDVARQGAIGIGPGYQFWDNDKGSFSTAVLLSRARYKYRDDVAENFYAASLRWDYNRYINGDRLELYTAGELMRPLERASEISVDANVGLRYKITNWMSWFFNFSVNQISGARENLNEKRLSTGLGLNW